MSALQPPKPSSPSSGPSEPPHPLSDPIRQENNPTVAGPSTSPSIGVIAQSAETDIAASQGGIGRVSGEEVGSITPPVPKCHLRVLIISGQSHVFSFEPEITVGRMKEILWSSWPSEWTSPSAPPSPAFLRVLFSGRILQDDSTLSSNNLPASLQTNNPTVVHISVRSFSLRGDEGDPKKGFLHPTLSRTSRRNEEVTSGGCKCVIM